VKFGPIIEHNDINVNKIGFFSNIFLDEENNDVKQSIVNPTQRGNTIEIECSPISLPHFNLYNILIFNVNYAKEKYKFVTHDLDDLVIHFCGNINLCLIICILCFILLMMDLVALAFDWSSWNRLYDLYSFSSDAVHFKLLFTLFIFLYLKNKNSCTILMAFCAAKMAVCLWKLLDRYDIELVEVYPYVRITRSTGETGGREGGADSGSGIPGNDKPSIDKASIDSGAGMHKNQAQNEVEGMEKYIKIKMPYVMMCAILFTCAYNFIYTPYDSVFSFIIHTSAVCCYLFNFLFMCPQIVRNYSTKTVERVPLFFFFFLFLYVLMDDLFALVLRIPLVHKWNALGDDIVFFIFLVQYCLYKKGSSRVGASEVTAMPQAAKAQRESKKRK
ncbi:hypothetical protein AK88_05657, partial [Plasmodium fragile]